MHKKVIEIKNISSEDLVVLIPVPSMKRDHFYQEYASQSHFGSVYSDLGSTVQNWVITVAVGTLLRYR